jgi:hypothetical protein
VLSGIVVALVLVFGTIGAYVFWSRMHERALAQAKTEEEMELTQMITDIPRTSRRPMKARPEWPRAMAVVASRSRRKPVAVAEVDVKSRPQLHTENCRRLTYTFHRWSLPIRIHRKL